LNLKMLKDKLLLARGGRFRVEVAVDFKTGEIRANATFGERVGLRGKAAISGFAEPSQKIGNELSAKHTLAGDASAELKAGPIGSVEASIEGELGVEISTSGGGIVANIDPTLSGNLGPVSLDDSGRASVSLGAGLGASAGLDTTVSANFSIPDTIDAAKNLGGNIKQGVCDALATRC
jgi:hypothetical protein